MIENNKIFILKYFYNDMDRADVKTEDVYNN